MKVKEFLTAFTMPFGILGLIAAITLGCENKETILDVEGPDGGGVEVQRDRDDGAVGVDVNDGEGIDIDAPDTSVDINRDAD
ncbi:MAG TPA: hypothetical protein VEQ85_15725 [Lacipirellulaceae bacterium]|nr:hypothetical protein [Lacipirellulaceae bacterium]